MGGVGSGERGSSVACRHTARPLVIFRFDALGKAIQAITDTEVHVLPGEEFNTQGGPCGLILD